MHVFAIISCTCIYNQKQQSFGTPGASGAAAHLLAWPANRLRLWLRGPAQCRHPWADLRRPIPLPCRHAYWHHGRGSLGSGVPDPGPRTSRPWPWRLHVMLESPCKGAIDSALDQSQVSGAFQTGTSTLAGGLNSGIHLLALRVRSMHVWYIMVLCRYRCVGMGGSRAGHGWSGGDWGWHHRPHGSHAARPKRPLVGRRHRNLACIIQACPQLASHDKTGPPQTIDPSLNPP